MGFEVRPYPEFSWSISRQRLLDDCPRAYYYRYYLSHKGWMREAPPASRLAYRLSKLTGLDALLGQEVDERAREVEECARLGRPLPSAEGLEAATRASLRAAWQSSKDHRTQFEDRPKDWVMLRSFYLKGGPPPEVEVARVNQKLAPCLRNLLAVPHWQRLAECGRSGCVEIPTFGHFLLNEVKVFAAGDLAYVHDGVLFLIDWKTGRKEGDQELQVLLSIHALRRQQPFLATLPARGNLHYLAAGRDVEVTPGADLEELVTETVSSGVRQMRRRLRDPEVNAPFEEAEYERRESALCPICNYAPLCTA